MFPCLQIYTVIMIVQHVDPFKNKYKMDLNAFMTKKTDKYLN